MVNPINRGKATSDKNEEQTFSRVIFFGGPSILLGGRSKTLGSNSNDRGLPTGASMRHGKLRSRRDTFSGKPCADEPYLACFYVFAG